MAFFKFRKGGDEQPTPPTAAESVEAMRRRARHRLIGAAVLVLLGVIGFPLLFDSQPRPIAVDIPIEIPDKAKVAPLGSPPAPVASGAPSQVSGGAIQGDTPAPVASAPAKPEPKAPAKPEMITELKTPPKPAAKPEVKAEAKPEAKPAAKPAAPADKPAVAKDKGIDKGSDGSKAQALLDGKPVASKPADKKSEASDGRFVVQVGAYVEAAKLREARQKVESLGFKTYTQVVGTKDAQRTRVRIGPFANKAEAQKAADKIKKLSLPAAILEL
jgi:DedD protein